VKRSDMIINQAKILKETSSLYPNKINKLAQAWLEGGKDEEDL
jgi:hypothetical protein